MPDPRRVPAASEEGPTLQFARELPRTGERCLACPHRHVPQNMSRSHAVSAPVLPVPPLLGPGAAPPPTAARPATLPRPSRLPEPLLAATPRASLLPAIDPHATLVLPDALKPGGPEAATVERPAGGPGQVAATARDAAPPDAARRPSFDELASPDITMMHRMHHVTMPARPAVGRPRPARAVVDTRAYFLLNLCLGLLIIGGLALLLGRDREAPAAEDHVGR